MSKVTETAKKAKVASRSIRNLSEDTRNTILTEFAKAMIDKKDQIISANKKDMSEARNSGMSEAFLDRLKLDETRIRGMVDGVLDIVKLPDPLHKVLEEKTINSGIRMQKITVPMGVIAIIFESRPNVTADCAALCFKAGSACILKGGKESLNSCKAITDIFREVLRNNNINEDSVVLLGNVTHEESRELMHCREYVDLLIPRGSRRLIEAVVTEAKVPVIETGAGVCHAFVDESADFEMAVRIIINAKCSRPSVCNALECLLVHEKIAEEFLPMVCKTLEEKGVVIYGDEKSCGIVNNIEAADEEAYYTEYNDLKLNLKIVKDVAEAIEHIEEHGTHHSDVIISNNSENVISFFNEVDSACVYHNASTRFTDGGMFMKGAEIGISTQKLHARGPMGLDELVTYAYYLKGEGQIR